MKKVLDETEIMKESLKCKLEYIENKSIELEKIELFNNAEEIRKNLDDIFDERKKEYLKFFDGERKSIESENSKNKKELEEFKNKIEEKRNYFKKPILIISAICIGISFYNLFKTNSVSNLINEHEKKLTYKGAVEKANNKDKEIRYEKIGEWVEEGNFKIKVNSLKKESGTIGKEKDIINITVENISNEDMKIDPTMFNVVGENGSKTKQALTFDDKITQIVNRGRKATFDYAVYPEEQDINLELEFGRVVVKLE